MLKLINIQTISLRYW